MPALTLAVSGLCLGGLFAWAATPDLRQRSGALQSEAAWVVALYCLLAWSPCVGLLLSFHTDWSLSYLVSGAELPTGALPAGILLSSATPFVGYLLASGFARRRRVTPLLLAGAIAVFCCLVAALLTLPRLLVVGSTHQFANQFGLRKIAGSGLGYALLYSGLITVVVSLWTTGALRRMHSVGTTTKGSVPPPRVGHPPYGRDHDEH